MGSASETKRTGSAVTQQGTFTADELNHALRFFERWGASDVFPEPFEVAAIRYCWDRVRPVMEGIEMSSYRPKPAVEMIAPKHYYTVRPIQLIDPVDLILYTALVFRFADRLQAKRDTYQDERVFSCRFLRGNKRTPHELQYAWEQHRTQLKVRTLNSRAVATADIADFFPRIYLHRLQNAISAITGDEMLGHSLMQLLTTWSHGASYGIPVGPRVSDLVAEAVLVEVDEYLLSTRVDFIRYVDDYTLFGKSESDCATALYELGSRLFQAEGLTLNMLKTRLWSGEEYLDKRVARTPQQDIERRIIEDIFGGNLYARVEYDELTEEQQATVNQVDAEELLEAALSGEPADLQAAKFVLSFLSAFQRPDLVTPVINNLPRLIAVSEAGQLAAFGSDLFVGQIARGAALPEVFL